MKAKLHGMIELPREYHHLIKYYTYNRPLGPNGFERVTSVQVSDRGTLLFPRSIQKLKKYTSFELEDLRTGKTLEQPFKLNPKFKPYEYQEPVIDKVVSLLQNSQDGAGILNAETSFGKSFVIPFIVEKLKQKTLIITDRDNLVRQMYGEFQQNVSEGDFQILNKDTKNRIADVNITTFQFLNLNRNLLEILKNEIGLVVVDEAHTIGAKVFTELVTELPSLYRLGLTATPTRSDGLTELLHETFGHNIIKGAKEKPVLVKHLLVNTGMNADWLVGEEAFSKIFIYNYLRPDFMKLVLDTAESVLKRNRAPLLYINYQDLKSAYAEALKTRGYSVAIIDSKTPAKQRKQIIDNFQARKLDFIISGVILQKGISIHRLDTILNLHTHTKESLEQTVGRLRRDNAEKQESVFIDFLWGGVLRKNTNERVDNLRRIALKYGDKVERYERAEWESIIKQIKGV